MTRDPLDRAAQVGALLVFAALAVLLCVSPTWPVALGVLVSAALVGVLRTLARRDLGAEVDALRAALAEVRALAEDAKKQATKALEAAHAARKPAGPGF